MVDWRQTIWKCAQYSFWKDKQVKYAKYQKCKELYYCQYKWYALLEGYLKVVILLSFKFVLYPSLWSVLIGHWLFYSVILSLNWILTSRNWIRNTNYANHARTLLIIIWRHKPLISKHSYWTVTFNSPSLLQQRCVYL